LTLEEAEAILAKRDPVADWNRCKGYIAEAMAEGAPTHALEDIEFGIAKGIYHFWAMPNSAIITEVQQFPRARHLHIFLAGGDLDELLAAVPRLKSWGAYLGCSLLTLAGRPGWVRVLKNRGWRQPLAVVSTTIEPTSNDEQSDTDHTDDE
jgi:hypothetical protein